ncbi:MAG: hypothetical protein DHS20C15_26270 [Planctomycetota bacterium]|nr:MAG: hypothetical protein DHS20C15_26270 [Planctomycetota bacterium]
MSPTVRDVLCSLTALALLATPALSDDTPTASATYQLTFQAQWNATNHPDDFPLSAHFSSLIGATHDSSFVLWDAGGIASPGMESMAEAGATGTLSAEINAQLGAGGVGAQVNGPALFGINNSVSTTLTVDLAHPLVSVVTMVAPSPDWFVGVHGLSLMENGNWVAETTVELLAYDSGTDSGASFASPNADVTPHQPIALQSGNFPLGNLIPLGTFTFTRTDLPESWSDLGGGLAGNLGLPVMTGTGALLTGEVTAIELNNVPPSTIAPVVVGLSLLNAPFKQGVLVPAPDQIFFQVSTGPTGSQMIATLWPAGVPAGVLIAMQWWIQDSTGPAGWTASNAVCTVTL